VIAPVGDAALQSLPARMRPKARMSVLDITEWFGETSGGIRTYVLSKARYVAARPSLRHVLVVPGNQNGVHDGDGVRTYRLRGPAIPGQRPYRFMLATKSIARITRHERPDLIEVGSPFLVPWLVHRAVREQEVPLVYFYHTNLPRLLAPLHMRQPWRGWIDGGACRYMRRLDRLFPVTIVASATAAEELAAQGIDRVVRVPLGVDLDHFTPTRRERARETRRLHALPDTPLAGYVGRFAREKSLDRVLDAWSTVERETGTRLVLIGAGPMADRLRAHPYGHRVIFRPFLHDREALADLVASLDVYVAPGPIETFGLSALEAAACGVPVLSADRGGVAEQVRASGGGRLFVADNAASLAEEAITLLKADLPGLGAKGRRYAAAEHAWDVVFDRLFAVYQSVLPA
jgi:alpha-1,6-mannosyltransferase